MMKNLRSISTSAFAHNTIIEFDAPNLNSISIDKDMFSDDNLTFTVGKKNFKDSPGII